MAIAVLSGDGVAQHPTTVALWFVILSMAHATQLPTKHQSRHQSPRTARAAQTAILIARLALDLGSATVALSTAIVETQMRIAGRDVNQLLVLVHS